LSIALTSSVDQFENYLSQHVSVFRFARLLKIMGGWNIFRGPQVTTGCLDHSQDPGIFLKDIILSCSPGGSTCFGEGLWSPVTSCFNGC